MCCSFETFKRVVPFAITFAVGLFVASLFYSFTSPVVSKDYKQFNRMNKVKKHKKTYCNMDRQFDVEQEVILLDSDIEEESEVRIIRPTFDETIIINEETENFDK